MKSEGALIAEEARRTADRRDESLSIETLGEDLAALVEGDVRVDLFTRTLYATDASIYRVMPLAVVMPRSVEDVRRVCTYAYERNIPILPRCAGTSLAGQAVNEAIVLDFTRYMNGLLHIDPEARTADVEPGLVLADLNRQLAPFDLKFAPDPASGNRSTVGGAIGNNSSGAHSLVYGMTDAYVDSVDVVLDDGTLVTFGEVSLEQLEEKMRLPGREGQLYRTVHEVLTRHGAEIEARFPKLKRNASGYNLARIILEGSLNLARLITGSEGTLGVIVKARIRLEPVPKATAMALLSYASLIDAMHDVNAIVQTGAAAVEVMDDVMLDLAAKTREFAEDVRKLPTGTSSALIVEYYGDDDKSANARLDALLRDFVATAEGASEGVSQKRSSNRETATSGRAIAALPARSPEEKRRMWSLRTAGLPILLSRTSDEKHIPFIEDAAIPPERLPEYVQDLQAMLERHGTYASFYAHAGPGVLHVRPLINTKSAGDVERMYAMAEEATRIVMRYGGVPSGEHGDGRSRTQWNRIVYGETLWQAFLRIKEAFDPKWILNPGQVVYRDDAPTDLRENLRFTAVPPASPTSSPGALSESSSLPFEPQFRWAIDNGMQGMVDLCHGCAGCRVTSGGVMCPTFRAGQEEILTTRGRANLLREAIAGQLPQEVLESEAFHRDVLDLCIGCKGCKRDCPSQVDMTKLKVELKHAHHQRHGIPWRERLFSRTATLYRWGSALAPVSNWAARLPGSRYLAERLVGITSNRPLPVFHHKTFRKRFQGGHKAPSPGTPQHVVAKVKLFVDCHTNHLHPEIGQAAVRLLEAAGVYVELAPQGCCGRPALSKGVLDYGRQQAQQVGTWMEQAIEEGWDIVGLEPSCVSMMHDEYADLLEQPPPAEKTYEIMEYLHYLRAMGRWEPQPVEGAPTVIYHAHCHQKALKKETYGPRVLQAVGFDVHVVDSSCCGMAGSFGYEKEHYDMSMAIGRLLFDQLEKAKQVEGVIVAPGASCQAQIVQGMGQEVYHPAVLLAKYVAPRKG